VQFERATTEEQRRDSVELLMMQHNQRWRERGGSDAFDTPGLIALHEAFSALALARNWLRLYVLRLDGQAAACLYGFLYQRKFYFYQSGFDASYSKYSAGLVAMGLAIQAAIAEGAVEFDLLHGLEAYKSHWSRHSRGLGRVEAYPPGWLGCGAKWTVRMGRAARGAMRGLWPRSVSP